MSQKMDVVNLIRSRCRECCFADKCKKSTEKCESWCKKYNSCGSSCNFLENSEVTNEK